MDDASLLSGQQPSVVATLERQRTPRILVRAVTRTVHKPGSSVEIEQGTVKIRAYASPGRARRLGTIRRGKSGRDLRFDVVDAGWTSLKLILRLHHGIVGDSRIGVPADRGRVALPLVRLDREVEWVDCGLGFIAEHDWQLSGPCTWRKSPVEEIVEANRVRKSIALDVTA
jgi:hypothetical protein